MFLWTLKNRLENHISSELTGNLMRRGIIALGVYLLVLGITMPLLLNQLSTVTFRGDIPPWRTASIPLLAGGVILVLIGYILRAGEGIASHKASRYFGYAALANVVAAVIFISPVLIPTLEFPILITRWPGIYMVTAYLSFLLVGVLGSFGWSLAYSNSPRLFNRGSFDKGPYVVQFILYQVGIYGLAFFMFWGGYTGAALNYSGGGDALVGIVMESNVIPSAIFIYTLMFASILGVISILSGGAATDTKIPVLEAQQTK